MSGSGVSAPPEWLCTTNAPPAGGKDCKPRTSARNHRLTIGPTTFVNSSLKAGSHLAISELSISLRLMPSPAVCALCLGGLLRGRARARGPALGGYRARVVCAAPNFGWLPAPLGLPG